MAPVLLGSQAAVFLEDVREVALARECERGGDLGDRVVRGCEHRLGGLEFFVQDVIADRVPCFFFEEARKVRRREIRDRRQGRERDARVQVFVDVVDRRADGLGCDGAALEREHLLRVVQAHLVVDVGDLFRCLRFVGHADVVVTERIGFGLREAP